MLLAPLFVSGLLGVWRGVVREVMSVLAWVIGVVLAGRFAADLAQLLPINGDLLPHAVAWVLVLLAVLIAAGLLARLLKQLL
ncbi:MAG: CvpA family protein, partial [Betaproteobacteria bacterium]|nr:CvpA family protein [Betaproteobacteria bacterium]